MIQTINPAFYSKQWKDIDNKVIQGLSMAIDRDTIIKTVLSNTREPATGWVAKNVKGYKADACGEYCKFDAKKAKALIKEGGGVPGNKISIQYNADQPHKGWVTAVCNSITQSTGVKCVGDPKTDFQADTQTRDAKKVKSLYRSGWVLDYPFNGNFLRDLYGTGVAGNQGGYSNKKFDQLTKQADAAPTTEESAKLYQQAGSSPSRTTCPASRCGTASSRPAFGEREERSVRPAGHPIFTEVEVFEKCSRAGSDPCGDADDLGRPRGQLPLRTEAPMGRYVARRLLQMIPVFIGTTLLIFFMVKRCPATPCGAVRRQAAGPDATARHPSRPRTGPADRGSSTSTT